MTQRVVHRPARIQPPQPDLARIEVVAPPALPDSGGGFTGMMQVALPIMGGGGMLLMMVSNNNPIMLVAGSAMMLVTVLGAMAAFVGQRTGAARRFAQQRRRYLDYLDTVRDDIAEAAASQRVAAHHRHPDPARLPGLVRDPHRLWERRLSDPDFLVLRAGLGVDVLWRGLNVGRSANPMIELDPITQAAAQLVAERERTLDAMPVAVPVEGVVSVVGPPDETRNLLRALVSQLVVLHAPDDVRLAWCVGAHRTVRHRVGQVAAARRCLRRGGRRYGAPPARTAETRRTTRRPAAGRVLPRLARGRPGPGRIRKLEPAAYGLGAGW